MECHFAGAASCSSQSCRSRDHQSCDAVSQNRSLMLASARTWNFPSCGFSWTFVVLWLPYAVGLKYIAIAGTKQIANGDKRPQIWNRSLRSTHRRGGGLVRGSEQGGVAHGCNWPPIVQAPIKVTNVKGEETRQRGRRCPYGSTSWTLKMAHLGLCSQLAGRCRTHHG